MSGTSTIYTNILDLTLMDNIGLEVTWTGTPTGTLQLMGSNSGAAFYALTFSPVLGQPAGASGGYLIDVVQYPFTYFMIEYTNVSGTGAVTAWLTARDLN
jgi:uncharacterized membrane protein